MSEKRVIRINKVLRELNISLERAVDFLKEKNHVIESSPNAKISQEEYDVLCDQFSADKGKKVASQEVSEEKKKEKEAFKRELEKELEILRSIFFDAQTYKKEEKIEALKLSKNVSIRIFTKRYLDFQENISQLIKENDRLAEIEKNIIQS